MLTPILTEMNRNLNRCVRTAYSFGCRTVATMDCKGGVRGRLFSAEMTRLEEIRAIPSTTIVLEVDGEIDVSEVDWRGVTHVAVGGESFHWPKQNGVYARCKIATPESLCLTGEAALAIAMYAASQHAPIIRYVGWGCWAAPLPRRSDVMQMQGRVERWYDLTQRKRLTVERACIDAGIEYVKCPTPHDAFPDVEPQPPCVVSCFHGRDRTGRFVREWWRQHANCG